MSEALLSKLLLQAYKADFKEFDNAKPHKFSHRHNRAMKRVLNGCVESDNKTKKLALRRRISIAAAIIIASALLTVGIAAIVTNGFSTKPFRDHTEAWAVDTEGCPETLENVYYLSEIPKDYIKESEFICPSFTDYEYSNGEKHFSFTQSIKKDYIASYNTEGYEMEQVEINDFLGFFIDFGENGFTLAWDNGDYILEINGNIDKNMAIYLAKSAKY